MCEELAPPLNGAIDYTSEMTPLFSYLTNVTYSCEVGFRLIVGDRVRTCVGSASGPGEWSGTVPICEGVIRLLAHRIIKMYIS